MKKINFLMFVIIISVCFSNSAFTQAKKFDIVIEGLVENINSQDYPIHRLKILKDKWGATAILLWLKWGENEPNHGYFNFDNLDLAINKVLSYNLKVYIRVATGYHPPLWATPGHDFQDSEYQIKVDGQKFSEKRNNVWVYPLNFVSSHSKGHILQYIEAVCSHLSSTFRGNKNIEYIFPSVSVDSEMEYPYGDMCGYSEDEINSFRVYLQNKYETIQSLNNAWGPYSYPYSDFTSFDEIDPSNYNWNLQAGYNNFYIPKGRVDWMNYRTSTLKGFIDECVDIIQNPVYNYKAGIELGSIYDNFVERRGWYDPTILAENVDFFKIADIIEYKPNFEFAADYMRSICKYWSTIKGKGIKFATETNYPTYGPYGEPPYPPALKCSDWAKQLSTYYWKGSSAHFICTWDYEPSVLEDLADYTQYGNWKDTLCRYSGLDIHPVTYSKAVHLSCEQGNFEGNNYTTEYDSKYDCITYMKFKFLESISPQGLYIQNGDNYDDHCEIITSSMIENLPDYINTINNFTKLYFTKSSKYITDAAYLKLMTNNLTVNFENATWYSQNGRGKYNYTQGLRNEYNNYRSPIHLIWRSRNDVRAIWPNANLPAENSGHTEDFISWANAYGCGNAYNPPDPEYPEWHVYYDADGKYNYDEKIRKVWDNNDNLQNAYNDAHYRSIENYPINMIAWAIASGDPSLPNYNNWPYIGGSGSMQDNSLKRTLKENATINSEYSLNQNYPNPFNPVTKIKYSIPRDLNITIVVYDILGREIIKLVNNEFKRAGNYEVIFDGSNLASGMYFYKMSAGQYVNVKKMLLIK